MSKGPLAVRWGPPPAVEAQAGARGIVSLSVENAGSLRWREGISVAYHWLDSRDNPIVWDGLRTPAPRLAPGEHATIEARLRAPIPPGGYRLGFDMVAERRAWFSELGSPMLKLDVTVQPRVLEPHAELPEDVEPAADWDERVRSTHAEGYSVVAGAIAWEGGPFTRRPHALAPYRPGGGRMPGFSAPLVCPSVAPGVRLERLDDVAGLPAYAAPLDEPWVYDGRIVLTARPRSGRPRP